MLEAKYFVASKFLHLTSYENMQSLDDSWMAAPQEEECVRLTLWKFSLDYLKASCLYRGTKAFLSLTYLIVGA